MKPSHLLHPTDPGHFALRSALRVAIVAPLAFAVGNQINPQTALFALFGSLAMAIFADFAGPPPVRILAYAGLGVTGLVLITIGTLCSRSPIAGAASMAIVGFAVLFAGVVNGYLASGTSAALLSFVLPVMVAADPSEIPHRLLGWALACAFTIPAILLVFPRQPRDRLRTGIADSCRAVAGLVDERTPETRAAALEAIDELNRRFRATPYRPTGPTGSTGALAEMVDDLDWLTAAASTLIDANATKRATASEQALHAHTVRTLTVVADLIGGDLEARPDIDRLVSEREQILQELLDQLAEDEHHPEDDEELWARLMRAWQVRAVSFIALDIAEKALVASGSPQEDGSRIMRYIRRQSVALAATRRLAVAHADARSVWFRNSLRGAAGLAAGVLIAQETNVQHGFWVVLGVISVLRSSAVGTSRSIVQAFLGTLAGIVIGALIVLVIGDHRELLWVVLPIAVFFAAFAPKALSFAAGQAGFSVAVLIAFNLIAPTGWQVGLVRIEDVSIGFAISLGVGVLFWPRGATALLRRSLGTAFVTSGRYTAAICARMFGGVGPVTAEQAEEAQAAEDRLDIALRQRLSERGAHDNERLAAGIRLVSGAGRIRRTGRSIEVLYGPTMEIARPVAVRPLIGDAHGIGDWFAAFGEALSSHRPPPPVAPTDPVARPALLDGVREAVNSGDRPAAHVAVACVWTELQLELLGQMQERIATAAAAMD